MVHPTNEPDTEDQIDYSRKNIETSRGRIEQMCQTQKEPAPFHSEPLPSEGQSFKELSSENWLQLSLADCPIAGLSLRMRADCTEPQKSLGVIDDVL